MNATNLYDCRLFAERLNRVLDGDEVAAALLDEGHYSACADCRASFAAAKLMAAYRPIVPAPPANFAATVTAKALADRVQLRRQRIMASTGIAALAASVAVAVWINWPGAVETQATPVASVAPQGMTKPLADAREAFVSLGSQVADESLTPAKNLLFAGSEKPKAGEAVPVSTPLADFPEAAKAGLEPLGRTPRRAINLFFRDVGGMTASHDKTNS